MKVFVFAEASAPSLDSADICFTRVFKSFQEAKEMMDEKIDSCLYEDFEKWHLDWGGEPDSKSAHLTSVNGNQIAMSIDEHEI